MTSPATKLRLELAAIGITPLPSTVTKEVFLPEWTTRVIDEAEILSWDGRRDWPNTSARLGPLSGLDLDIRDEEAVDTAELLVRTRFDGRGMILLRTGRAPKRLIPFCVDAPFTKRVLCYRAPNGDPHRIEFLCEGQQAVFYGQHESGKPYTWHADLDPLKAPPAEWVTITEAEVDALLAELDEMLVEQFNYTRVAPPGPNGAAKPGAHVTDVDAALATTQARVAAGTSTTSRLAASTRSSSKTPPPRSPSRRCWRRCGSTPRRTRSVPGGIGIRSAAALTQ